LAGGEGTRLAPISTPQQPKPFIPLPDGRSLLTRTLQRVLNGSIFLPPLLVGHASHRFALLNHARAAGILPQAILLEPQAKNTAMAIACAASWALAAHPHAVLAILPADQVIEPVENWVEAIQQAAEASVIEQKLCLLGVTPTRADPNFGYITLAPRHADAFAVSKFTEKPSNPEDYMVDAVWNAGQFIAPARVIEAIMLELVPEIWMAAQHAVASATREWEFTLLGQAAYAGAPAQSFDRAVMERAPSLCVRLSAHWHDLGTIEAWEAFTCQPATAMLERPLRTDRPWGYYELLKESSGRLEKRLTIFPGCRLSRQRHRHRSEIWHVLEGVAEIELGDTRPVLNQGEKINIPAYEWHRLYNPGIILLIIHEIQCGSPDELDIERSEDDYGRLINTK
jgi:mannose-1-phosphate guanylyltransferase